ncbi:MAG: cytochrome-c peroxidase [Halobacteriovoraceae bacterium]|nr:cytochrome-c peroxidase [Halobacteriovoraceae bacterium]
MTSVKGSIKKEKIFCIFFLSTLLISCENSFNKTNFEVHSKYSSKFKELKIEFSPGEENLDLIDLGRSLFYDTILSRNNDVSCSTCHLPNHGFSDGNSLSFGTLGKGGPTAENVGNTFAEGVLSIERGVGNDGLGYDATKFMFRNSLSLYNVKFREGNYQEGGLMHDGRFASLMEQLLVPMHTRIEMCGTNPIPLYGNPFKEKGDLFNKSIHLKSAFSVDHNSNTNFDLKRIGSTIISGLNERRPNNALTVPNRNECVAIMLAKLNNSSGYNKKFKKLFNTEYIDEVMVKKALESFVKSIVVIDTPFDKFMKKEQNLSEKELLGLQAFFTDVDEEFSYKNKTYQGAGCFKCHEAPLFSAKQYYDLGVRGHELSPLSSYSRDSDPRSGFFKSKQPFKGSPPECEIDGRFTEYNKYVPDPGRAFFKGGFKDCFRFRVPSLRGVIETYPYFHHGTERGQNRVIPGDDFYTISYKALKNAIEYHLIGPVNIIGKVLLTGGVKGEKSHIYQRDIHIPYIYLQFHPDREKHKFFPIKYDEDYLDALTYFVAHTLRNPSSSKTGLYGNDLSPPSTVPSGLYPPITRDNGTQMDFPLDWMEKIKKKDIND